jgi:hypothetical protein
VLVVGSVSRNTHGFLVGLQATLPVVRGGEQASKRLSHQANGQAAAEQLTYDNTM